MRALAVALTLVLGAALALPARVAAQPPPDSVRTDSLRRERTRADSLRADSLRADSLRAARADTVRRIPRRLPVVRAPLSPRRAFLYSALVPGLAQSRLERATSGALFATVEMASIAMLRRSQADVKEVRRQDVSPIPGNFTVNPATGEVTAGADVPPRFEEGIERSRRLHVEDWTAALIFNHLIAGADAFVAAQLWDVPARVNVVPTRQGLMLVTSVRW